MIIVVWNKSFVAVEVKLANYPTIQLSKIIIVNYID